MTPEEIPNLTPAELERLALLSEEMGEAQQIIGKILRHGHNCHHPDDINRVANRRLLEVELGHVAYAVDLLVRSGDLHLSPIVTAKHLKAAKVVQYLHHQPEALLKPKAEGFL